MKSSHNRYEDYNQQPDRLYPGPIDLAFFWSTDRRYGLHTEVNAVSIGSVIIVIMLAHVLKIA